MKLEAATQLRRVTATLHSWAAYQPDWQIHFHSYAVVEPDGLVLIDPTLPAPGVRAELEKIGPPLAIILTNAHHDRAADWFRKTYAIQVYASEKAPTDCDIKIDVPVLDGERLPGGLQAVFLPGVSPSEMALHAPGLLMLGDALLHKPTGLELMPAEFIEDSKAYRQALEKLRKLDYDLVTFAHGEPLLTGGKTALANFLKPPPRARNSTGKGR
jgi:glyoxylase-like metal-dependent hydrolase (beta-lactamase superfamily II)